MSIQLAKERAELCEFSSKSAKQFKPSGSQPRSSSRPCDEDEPMSNAFSDEDEDNSDVIFAKSNCSSATVGTKSSADLRSLDDALKYVTKINKSTSQIDRNAAYLSEHVLLKLIKSCKENQLCDFGPLISLVQRVFQSYKSLSLSFTYRKEDGETSRPIEISSSMPSMPPFNIDLNSVRRAYSMLFGLSSEAVVEQVEDAIDHAVYALCISIKMLLKKNELSEEEMNEILHALLVVNELPILEEPKYMDRCAKIFYSTMSELPDKHAVKIIRMWSKWNSDELRILLNKLQQYITVCAISKNLDEESNNRNEEEDGEEVNETERNCLHKSEGIAGAVGCLRLIYYASLLGGRLDSEEQIKRERLIEVEELKYLESSFALEENNASSEAVTSLSNRIDPLEEILNIRPFDCREPKIPNDQFLNEVVNTFIDIQHDYVEYIQQVQNQEQFVNHAANKKQMFSFLAHPFVLVLAKKNLGLYYDNKIKMMRERRHNIMMSLLEGSMPMPYFKIRLQRSNLLVDALSLIELQEQENSAILRKQLFIEFENEQGIDQGGVSKEFFQLAIDELLNKGYSKLNTKQRTLLKCY